MYAAFYNMSKLQTIAFVDLFYAGIKLFYLCSSVCVVRAAKEVHHLLLWRPVLYTKSTGNECLDRFQTMCCTVWMLVV